MNTLTNKNILRSIMFCLWALCILPPLALAANFPLQVLIPRAAGTTPDTGNTTLSADHFTLWAYPGITYRMRAAIVGGDYPYTFALSGQPSGMTVDTEGVITWTDPQASDASITLTVTDASGTQTQSIWGVTVDTNKFRFLNCDAGTSGSGTLASPWRNISSIPSGSNGLILYFRACTATGYYNALDKPRSGSDQVQFNASLWSQQWLAYPGERPILNIGFQVGGDLGTIIRFQGSPAAFVGFQSINGHIKHINPIYNVHYGVYWDNEFRDLSGISGTNPAFIMTESDADGSTADYNILQNNDFHSFGHLNGGNGGACVKIYSQYKLLIEDNTCRDATGVADVEGFALKGSLMDRITVRHNTIYNVPAHPIGGNNHTLSNSEILFNRVYNASENAIRINQDGLITTPIYIYRNTFLGRVELNSVGASSGPFHFYNNVIVSSDPVGGCEPGSRIYCGTPGDASRIITTSNVEGTSATGITDSTGNLTSAYSSYLGTHGYQLGAGSPTPAPSDTTAPSISAITASSLTTSSATISWTTNEASDSQVEFDTAPCPCALTSSVVATLSTTHTIDLSGLSANTTYSYRVRSRDTAGNLATSATQTFATQAVPVTPPPTPTLVPANYPLQILIPRGAGTSPDTGGATISSNHRIFWAYPGIEYNIRAGVIGGSYPYTYSLVNAPSGMTINSATGEIRWPNPQASASNIALTVIDSGSTQIQTTWSITLDSSRFLFLDQVNGTRRSGNGCSSNCGTGTLTNPWKDISDWYGPNSLNGAGNTYESKRDGTNVNKLVYYKNGSYPVDGWIENGAPGRMPILSAYKPMAHMVFPGHVPIIDLGQGTSPGSFWHFYDTSDNAYVDGLTWVGTAPNTYSHIKYDYNGNYQVLRRNTMRVIRTNPPAGGLNQSCFMISSPQSSYAQYMILQDNSCSDVDVGSGFKIYSTYKMLIEDNVISNVYDTGGGGNIEGIAIKSGVDRATVRNNTIHDVSQKGIGGNMHSNGLTNTRDVEILFNRVYNASVNAAHINQDGMAGPIYFYRNTFAGRVEVTSTDSADGPFYFSNNVIESNDPAGGCKAGSRIYCTSVSDANRIIITASPNDDLDCSTAENCVSNTGDLQGSYSSYLGTHGYELGAGSPTPPPADTTAPSIPANLTATAISSSQINLSWNAATDNVGVTGYRIYRNGAQIATTTSTSYSNTGLSPGTSYSYTVAAYDAASNVSAQSTGTQATTQTPPDITPPNRPIGVTVQPDP